MDMTVPTELDSKQGNDVCYFEPDQTLINTIKRAVVNGQDIRITLEGCGELLLLSGRGEYFADIDDEPHFYTAPVGHFTVSVLRSGSLPEAWQEVSGREVEELLWKVAFYNSRGKLMQGCNPIDMVELNNWPNLTRIPHSPNAPRIAALLSQHSTTIAFVARLLKIPPKEVYQFYSAAYCAGMAKPINRTPQEPKLEPHRHQTLLAGLWKKLSTL